jgi:hypothetical protein
VLAGAQPADGQLSGNINSHRAKRSADLRGWTRNADGGYQFYFGYLNRNHVEEVQVPIGAENKIEPAGPDRGQPTSLYPLQPSLFSVPFRAVGPKAHLDARHSRTERARRRLAPSGLEIALPGRGHRPEE